MDIFISLPAQVLELYDGYQVQARYSVSTSENGGGESSGSFMTPRGRHVIRAKIGAGSPPNAVFVARRPTGEMWSPELSSAFPGRDWILTRILWLSGREPGCNRLGPVDTMRRYIYLHGSPDTAPMGKPGSHGCIRMRNDDIIALYDSVPPYTRVNIGDFFVVAALGSTSKLEIQALTASEQQIGRCVADSRGHIAELSVNDAWRRKGVARQLLRSLIKQARVAGLTKLTVASSFGQEAFWRGLEFQPTPELTMTLELETGLFARS